MINNIVRAHNKNYAKFAALVQIRSTRFFKLKNLLKPFQSIQALIVASLIVLHGCGGVDPDQPEGDFVPPVVEWQLVFSDEFDGDSVDTTKWNIEEGDGCPDLCGWGNNELQIYSADNVSVADGILRIEGREEAEGGYSSGRINTKGKFDFNYGRVVVRARIPSGQGTWPAIWALHSNPDIYGGWPQSGEIDIMEAFGYGANGVDTTDSTVHSGLPLNTNTFTTSSTTLADSADTTFHEYELQWERGRMRFFVDGIHYQTQDQDNWFTYYPADEDGFYDPWGPYTLGIDDAPFDEFFHLILNFAIGGNRVGAPDASTIFPQTFEIDYVRVYECANSNPTTRRGCGSVDPSVEPLSMHDGGNLEGATTANPYVERVDLYVDGPETISLDVGGEVSTNTLGVDGFTGENATVTSNPNFQDPDDAENIVWHVSIADDVANVFLASQDLTDDPLLDTGFNFSTAEPVGEIAFDMKINSVAEGTELIVKLDSGFPNLGQVSIPASEWAVGEWKTYSIKFRDLVANPGFVDCCGGTGVALDNVINPFVFEVVNGSADVYLDNIYVSNACYVVGACKAQLRTKGIPALEVFEDSVNISTWDVGIAAADSGSGFVNYSDGTDPANKVNWEVITDADPERGEVIEVTFNDSSAFGVWFIQSTTATDTSAYSAGAVVFDLIVDDYGDNTDGMTFKIDCFFPCTSGDKNLGVVADGVWETITIPVSNLTATGLDLASVNTGIVLFPTSQAGGITFRVDNIRWEAETEAPPLAQIDLPVTFEDDTVDYSLVDFAGASTVLEADPENADNTVARTIKSAGAETFAGTVIGTGDGFATPIPFTDTATTMSMMVYSPAAGLPVMLKVENDDASIFSEITATTTVANGWERLVWDFAGVDTAVAFNRAIIFFNFGEVGADETFYWDDVAFGSTGPASQVDLPVDFESAVINYDLGDFGGLETTLIEDPANAANTVASSTKGAGDELWAGVTVGATDGLANAIPFEAGSTTMTLMVYSPDAGIPVRLKVENAVNGSVSVETEALTTQANNWEMLTFDFTNNVASTPAIDFAAEYNKASVFFNFGTYGNTAGEKTYLWDDLAFVAGSGLAQVDLPISFDNEGVDYDVIAFGNASVTVGADDPENSANKVAMFNKPVGAELWAGATMGATNGLATDIPFTATDTKMSVRVYSPDAGIPVRLKVENAADGGISVETEATTTVANQWETLTFDFSNNVVDTPALDLAQAYQKVVIFFNFGTTGADAGDKTYYWENVEFGVPINLPITFEDSNVNYDIVAFGNASAMDGVEDPVDSMNTVAMLNKPPGAELWSGAVMGASSGLANEIPFTASATSLTVRVYSPDAGIPVRLKVENASEGSISVETEVLTTQANAWETLTFDFSNNVTDTPALDVNQNYHKVVIFFNFGTTGNDAGDKTYYWDDVSFGGTL
ncbi:glycoside hydrolase family 16 protein [Aliikangiella marina]|uniref:Glycoside hydrolase family 16 protein n=1 Tax=Aliikangiella marina TaxID=1712262 RepID=A0A545T2V6_9GAMM|nr:glycoside hydrolase family 16 protein [Aliikangiella marina]TQV71540.1 glycoside hydrolase family 16 protein [Aliikangiella marina]